MKRFIKPCSVVGALLMISACGPGPKSESLLELEALRAAPYTSNIRIDPEDVTQPRVQEIRTRAFSSIAESDAYHDAAFEAWEGSDDEVSDEYATYGVLMYRAAESYSRAADARDRIEQANSSYQLQLERRNRYNDMVRANEEVISLLLALQALYDQTEDCRADMAAVSAQNQARLAAEYALQEARWSQREAETAGSVTAAEIVYNEGLRLLAEAMGYNDGGQFQLAYDTAQTAQSRFREALLQAGPSLQEARTRAMDRTRNQGLFDDAVELFGENASADIRGVVVVLPNIFADRRTDIRSNQTYMLDQVAGLLTEHRRFDVTIEGHSSDSGSADSNVAISRARAEAVRDYLLRADVRSRRMDTEAWGEQFPRYSNRDNAGRDNNNRVELVFPYDD